MFSFFFFFVFFFFFFFFYLQLYSLTTHITPLLVRVVIHQVYALFLFLFAVVMVWGLGGLVLHGPCGQRRVDAKVAEYMAAAAGGVGGSSSSSAAGAAAAAAAAAVGAGVGFGGSGSGGGGGIPAAAAASLANATRWYDDQQSGLDLGTAFSSISSRYV